MKKIGVSIIMPSFNVKNYIEECLDSVMSQSMKDIEIICVDAGSSDGTFEIIQDKAKLDERIQIICSDKKSYGYQMNLGVKAAKGEYIGIVETDDNVDISLFETLFLAAKEYDVDFVKSGYKEFFGEDKERRFFDAPRPGVERYYDKKIELHDRRELGLADGNHIWSGIYKRQFLLKNNIWFNETLGASFQDTSFSILVGLLAKNCIYLHENLYNYRIDNINSSVKSNEKIFCVVDEFQYIISYLENNNIMTTEIDTLLCKRKLHTYFWNYMRLTNNSREIFIDKMQPYFADLQNKFLWNKSEKEKISIMCDIKKRDAYEKKLEETRKLLRYLKMNKMKNVNIVGAGQYALYIFEWEKLLGKKFVNLICDNSINKQNTMIMEHIITSVEEAIKQSHNDNVWIIANKYRYEEIVFQLERYGIEREKMFVCCEMIQREETLEIIR